MRILVFNGGSSSLKAWYHDVQHDALDDAPPQPLWSRHVAWDAHTKIEEVFDSVLCALPGPVERVGHRIVHGGKFHESTVLTPEVRAAIVEETAIAPAHNRMALAAADFLAKRLGSDVMQVAVFDTAFHATLTAAAYVYPGPYAWVEEGIRRYGFHGISHGYAVRRAAQILGRDPAALRLITCHLGSGASLAAVNGGRSVDTTMGFTPLDGLMMGSRSGSLDPGILLHLLRSHGYSADELDDILYRQSGLLGVSGISADMREILAAAQVGHARAQLAYDVYIHRLVREMGAMLAVLGGVDALVFTGGVGENCAPVRESVARHFAFLGLRIATGDQSTVDRNIATPDSALPCLVIRAQEEWEIARATARLPS
jgi:acetate kinase